MADLVEVVVSGSAPSAAGMLMVGWGRRIREAAERVVGAGPRWTHEWLRVRVELTNDREDKVPWAPLPATMDALRGVVFSQPRQVRELVLTQTTTGAARHFGRLRGFARAGCRIVVVPFDPDGSTYPNATK